MIESNFSCLFKASESSVYLVPTKAYTQEQLNKYLLNKLIQK